MRNLICIMYFGLACLISAPSLNAQNPFDADSALVAIISNAETSQQQKTTACLKLDSIAIAIGNQEVRGNIYARLAGLNFNTNPSLAIPYYKTAIILYKKVDNKPWTAFSYLNIGSVFDEKLKVYDSAVYYLNLSYLLWIEIGDTTQQANILKYLGLLKAKTGQFEEGIKDVRLSIDLFKKSTFPQGVAVAYFDLAGIWDVQKNSDSALYYYGVAKQMQTQNADSFRIAIINNKLIEIYRRINNQQACKTLISENEKLLPEKLFWSVPLEFYTNALKFYETIADSKNVKIYQQKREALVSKLKADGIQIE